MPATVDSVCRSLTRSHLLTPTEVQRLRELWGKEAGSAAGDVSRFLPWLVTRHYLTQFQLQRLLEGHTEHFFLGHYKLLDRIGHGTMARVYRATSPSGQLFAVKVLPPSRSEDPRWRDLFEREAKQAGRFNHPNVVRTLEAGSSGGLHYLVREYLEGETLEDVLSRRGRLLPAEAARLAHQALMGLQHIHDQKAIHGNMEPGHLMLVGGKKQSPTTFEAQVKLLDVALGRPLFDAHVQTAAEQVQERGHARLAGNVDYLSPERASQPEGGDIRSDIYSLGCILYHCLAGQPPFPGGTIMDRLIRHASGTSQPLKSVNPQVPEPLQGVVARMMARDPAHRFPDPASAAKALQPFLPGGKSPAAVPVAQAVSVPLAVPVAAPVPITATPPAAAPVPSPVFAQPSAPAVATPAAPVSVSAPVPAPAPRPHRPRAVPLSGRRNQLVAGAAACLLVGLLIYVELQLAGQGEGNNGGGPSGNQKTTPTGTQIAGVQGTGTQPRPQQTNTGPARTQPTGKQPAPTGTVPPRVSRTDDGSNPGNPDNPPPKDPPGPRTPIPAPVDQARADKIIKDLFKADYARQSPGEIAQLARKLYKQGLETRDDPAARFVLLREARDLASQAPDLAQALKAQDQLERDFAVDPWPARLGMFDQIARGSVSNAYNRDLGEKLADAIQDRIAVDDFETASRMLPLAGPAAEKSASKPLQRRVELLTQQVREMKAEHERLRAASATPADLLGDRSPRGTPEQKRKLGQYLCLLKGDWDRGLPLLAQGDNEQLRDRARADLTPTTDPTERVKRGDAWWDLAEAADGTSQRQFQARALFWYRQALPGLSGLTKARVEQRIKQATAM